MLHRALIALLGIATIASAEITGLRIIERSPVLDGKKFGKVGAYERVVARASFEADQATPVSSSTPSSEYWNRPASLLHTTLDGSDDAPLAAGTRIYYFAGTQHGSGTVPPRTSATLEYPLNANARPAAPRYLLDEDAPLVVEQALLLWDHYASAESTHGNSH